MDNSCEGGSLGGSAFAATKEGVPGGVVTQRDETALRGTSNWTRLRCQNAASALSHSVPARLGAVQGEPLASQLQPRCSLSGFGGSPAIRQRSVIGFGHARVLSVGNYQRRMWFRGQSCARGTGGMG